PRDEIVPAGELRWKLVLADLLAEVRGIQLHIAGLVVTAEHCPAEHCVVVFGAVVFGAVVFGAVVFGTVERFPVRGTVMRGVEITSWHVSSTGLALHRTLSSLRAST